MLLERTELRKLINEAIYGRSAIVYHGSRTPPNEFIKSYNSGGFQPGKGAGGLYGMGLYTVHDDKDLFVSNTGIGMYGGHVYKFKTNLNNFLALNEDTCKLVHGQVLTVRQQLEKIKGLQIQIRDIENSRNSHLLDAALLKKDVLSGSWAKVLSVFLMNSIVGMLFRGSNDGYVCLIFDDSNTFPIAYTTSDELKAAGTIKNVNWKKIDESDIKSVVKRSATTTAQPGKFMSNNLRDRSGAYGMTELEMSNVEVFLKRYEGLKKHIKINADVIPEEGYHYLKQKVIATLNSVDNIPEDQYKRYALEVLFFEKALSTASTLQGVINVIEFDDVFDNAMLGDRFGQETEIGNKAQAKVYDIVNTKYKNVDIATLSKVLPELRISRKFIEKTKGLRQSTGSFNIIPSLVNQLLALLWAREDRVGILVLTNNIIQLLNKIESSESIRHLSNTLFEIFDRETKKAGKEAATQINSGISPVQAIIDAVKNNRFLFVVVQHMPKANKDLNRLIISISKLTYGIDGVTQPGEYVMSLVLKKAFEQLDKAYAREAFESLSYFLNEKLIPGESTSELIYILQQKLK